MNNVTEPVLLDTNILIYATQEDALQHLAAKTLRDRALVGEVTASISPQILNEFFAVVTRSNRVSSPLTRAEAIDQIRKYYESEVLTVIYPGENIIARTLTLLDTSTVVGMDIHDLHLVATMLENGIKKIYTYNTSDFEIFSEIEVLTPPAP